MLYCDSTWTTMPHFILSWLNNSQVTVRGWCHQRSAEVSSRHTNSTWTPKRLSRMEFSNLHMFVTNSGSLHQRIVTQDGGKDGWSWRGRCQDKVIGSWLDIQVQLFLFWLYSTFKLISVLTEIHLAYILILCILNINAKSHVPGLKSLSINV